LIFQSSQSGLEAAKESLEEINRSRRELKDQTPHLDDGKISIPFWPSSADTDSSSSLNLAWVRTAAQAAMALKVHGMLETTGMPSASARLQHASLPSLGTSNRNSSWEDDDESNTAHARVIHANATDDFEGVNAVAVNNFEDGVVTVHSELNSAELDTDGDDGYDLLPLPVPAPERRILNAGSDVVSTRSSNRENRFHYGASMVHGPYEIDREENTCNAFLGDIAVDENIDKLREVIGSVDNTLSRCLASLGGIVKAQRERQALHLGIVNGLDSWNGMRGKFVSQRSLLKGVCGIEQSRCLYDEGDITMIDDISWQTSLANSAVAAAEDVRAAVRVSRTASNAKAAASSAAYAAQDACDTGTFASTDEARAAQTRASIAQSHAIHAAVVEYEAKTVKRRATLALAHDVKCWNVHRKRELLRSCISYARSQHEATRRAVDAWSSLRDGFIGSTVIPSAPDRRAAATAGARSSRAPESGFASAADVDEVTIYPSEMASSCPSSSTEDNVCGQFAIVAVEHDALSSSPSASETLAAAAEASTDQQSRHATPNDATDDINSGNNESEKLDTGLILPFATAAPIPEEEADEGTGRDRHSRGSRRHQRDRISGSTGNIATDSDRGVPSSTGASSSRSKSSSNNGNDEVLSGSMQSLIDGLMSWGGVSGGVGGGSFDAEEDHFALPPGMAASIALEESKELQQQQQQQRR